MLSDGVSRRKGHAQVRSRLMVWLVLVLVYSAWLAAQSANLTVLHVFQSSAGNPDGALPQGSIVEDTDGTLYGTTTRGGLHDCGTLYRVSRDGAFRLVYTFTGGGDGCVPQGVVQTADGAIFGSTQYGSLLQGGGGTLFRVGRSGALTTLFVFRREEDGTNPGPLVVGADGHLYGRTAHGGLANPGSPTLGTAFRLSLDGNLSVIHRFTNAEKTMWRANGALLLASDGQLYGTTTGCGSYGGCGDGTVFRLTPDGGVVRIATFPGQNVRDNLVQGADGRLYGSADSGVFAVTTSGLVTTFPQSRDIVLHARGPDGRFYGQRGGISGTDPLMISMSTDGTIAPVNEVPPLGQRFVTTLVAGRAGNLYGSAASSLFSGDPGLVFTLQPLPGVPRNFRIVR